MDERTILVSKRKLGLLIAGAIAFVAIGWWMLFQDAESAASMPPGLRTVMAMRVLAILCIIFFGACAAFGVRRFLDQRPGLVLSATGLLDRSSAFSGKTIAWCDIRGIHEVRIHRQRMLALELFDAEKFIADSSPTKAALYRLNIKLIGAPIAVSANALEIGFSDLENLCLEYWRKYQ